MPIKIPDQLPAHEILVREGVSVMDERTAMRQDIRPLQIGLLNLMPNKIRTETQFARLMGATPLQVELTLVRIGNHKAKNTSEEHLISFYQTWEEVGTASSTASSSRARPSSSCRSRRSTTGRNWSAFSTGRRRMFTPPSSSAGARWRLPGISTASPSIPSKTRPSASSGTATTRLRRPTWPASRMISPFRFPDGRRCARPIFRTAPASKC